MTETNYAHKVKRYFAHDRHEMVKYVPKETQSLLEIGCGGGEFMRLLRQTHTLHATAIEQNAGAVELARCHFDVVVQADVESGLRDLAGKQFDCIVLNDVLEHLAEPWETVQSIRGLLTKRGVVVASIPNVRYFPVLRGLALNDRWDYQDAGVLDRTHLRFFTQSSIRDMFESAGFRVDRLEGINRLTLTWKLRIIFFWGAKRLESAMFPQFACVARVEE